MNDTLGHVGEWQIIIKNVRENTIEKKIIKNRITDNAITELMLPLYTTASTPNMLIKYIAFGTSSTPVSTADTQLYAESSRFSPTVSPTKTTTGEVKTEFTILATEAVGQIEEIGIFCGDTASATANTGLMLSRILWSHNKTNTEEIIFKRYDRLVRA